MLGQGRESVDGRAVLGRTWAGGGRACPGGSVALVRATWSPWISTSCVAGRDPSSAKGRLEPPLR